MSKTKIVLIFRPKLELFSLYEEIKLSNIYEGLNRNMITERALEHLDTIELADCKKLFKEAISKPFTSSKEYIQYALPDTIQLRLYDVLVDRVKEKIAKVLDLEKVQVPVLLKIALSIYYDHLLAERKIRRTEANEDVKYILNGTPFHLEKELLEIISGITKLTQVDQEYAKWKISKIKEFLSE